jgi:hypothetical protein
MAAMWESQWQIAPLILVLVAGCEKPVPAVPSFETDVRPIFAASCIRCHGAGGTLNVDPLALRYIGSIPSSNLDQYDDGADCMPTSQGTPLICVRGAAYEAQNGNIHLYLHGPLNPYMITLMPPPPSPALGPWELAVIDNWVAESPPQR